MTKIVPIFSILFIVSVILIVLWPEPEVLRTDYYTRISVETPDRIENVISNVVSDLGKRNFVPVHLNVKWHPASRTYVIYASGIDRTKLGKYEP